MHPDISAQINDGMTGVQDPRAAPQALPPPGSVWKVGGPPKCLAIDLEQTVTSDDIGAPWIRLVEVTGHPPGFGLGQRNRQVRHRESAQRFGDLLLVDAADQGGVWDARFTEQSRARGRR